MIMSGITGPDQCLAAVGESTAMLEPCTEAIAAGDGREVWSFEGGGKIRNVVSNKCLEVHRRASEKRVRDEHRWTTKMFALLMNGTRI